MPKFLLSICLICNFLLVLNQPILATTLPNNAVFNSQKSFWAANTPPQYFGQKITFRDRLLLGLVQKVLKKQQNALACTQIFKKNGDIIDALIVKMTDSEVVYRLCDQPKGANLTILKVNIDFIQAADGAIIYKNKPVEAVSVKKAKPQKATTNNRLAIVTHVLGVGSLVPLFFLGIAGSISAILWIALLSFLLGTAATLVGIKQLQKINLFPDDYSGKTLTIVGLALGILTVGVVISGLVFGILIYFASQ